MVATSLNIICFGGAHDGTETSLESPKDSFKLGSNKYADLYVVDKFGRAVYFCSSGPGKLKRRYAEELFEDEL